MGRIKTKLTKRLTYQLLAQHKDHLHKTFDENKPVVSAHLEGASKKVRNVVAGFVTRKMRRTEE
jgi:small subunit ribosomal protein S17e